MYDSTTHNSSDDDGSKVICADELPEFSDYLRGLSWDYFVVLGAMFGCCLMSVALYADEIVRLFISRRHHARRSASLSGSASSLQPSSAADFMRHRTKWILAVYPALSVTSFVSLIIPRTSRLNDLVAAIYVSICVYVFMTMLIDCFGGAEKMLSNLRNQRISWAITAACCCPCCGSRPQLSSTSLQVLRSLVVQFAVVRPFIAYLSAIVSANTYTSQWESNRVSNYLGCISLLSTLMAVWAFGMVYQLCRVAMDDLLATIRPRFLCLQMVLLISGVQLPIIWTLVEAEVISCDAQLTKEGVAARWHHMIVVGEMLLLLSASKCFYRRRPLTPDSVNVIQVIEII